MMAYGSSGCYDLFPPETSEARRSWAESLLLGFDITGCCGLEFFRVLASKETWNGSPFGHHLRQIWWVPEAVTTHKMLGYIVNVHVWNDVHIYVYTCVYVVIHRDTWMQCLYHLVYLPWPTTYRQAPEALFTLGNGKSTIYGGCSDVPIKTQLWRVLSCYVWFPKGMNINLNINVNINFNIYILWLSLSLLLLLLLLLWLYIYYYINILLYIHM